MRDTPGKSLGEQLEAVLGKEAAKKVQFGLHLEPSCTSKGNFIWTPTKVSPGEKVRVFLPILVKGEVTVRTNGKAVWTTTKSGKNWEALSPEIELPKTRGDKDTPLLSVQIENLGSRQFGNGGVDDVFILRAKAEK